MTSHAFYTPWGDLTDVPNIDRAQVATLAANDNYPDLVALTGQAGAGKSTAASYLIERHGYTLVKFAGPLKDMCRALGLTEAEIEGDLKEVPAAKLCGRTPRHAMQTLGTQWGRDCLGPDFWAGMWKARAEAVIEAGGRVVVDDCRFPNEASLIRQMGGDIFKISGRGGIAGSHESERGTGSIADVVIENSGGIDVLHLKLRKALERWI